jgi:hypothetical protein
MKNDISNLIRELRMEAWQEGHATACYNHMDHSHTVEGRKKMQDHKAIADQIQLDIESIVKESKK